MKQLSELETNLIAGGVSLTISNQPYEINTEDLTDKACIDLFVLRVETADWMTINPNAGIVMKLLKEQVTTQSCTTTVDTLIDRFMPLRINTALTKG